MSLMYQVCYRTIARGSWPEDMAARITVFHRAGLISEEEKLRLMELLTVA